ncbi:MAG: M48 family metalloprotease [Proteobacteria bacterium]|nr:M48 family metalloprotease [Pseudomonadota bacterium]
MNDRQFDALVGRLEGQAQQSPGLYKLKVLLLATLGNAYIAVMLLAIIAVLVGLCAYIMVLKAIGVKLIIIAGFFLWMVLKALWVKIEPPRGTPVDAAQAPELFAMVNGLRRQLGAPPFHHVLITDDFNAGVVQSPRLGVFGWSRNYLLLGLPLMKTLTPDQFKAVLAHEFGHLAKGHGRVSNWIYRQRLRWSRLLHALDADDSWGSLLFKPFLNWFAPFFSAYTFPMARANEYQADATAAKLTSSRTAAEALTSVNVVGSFLAEKYWPGIHRHADEHPQPSFAPYSGMGHGVSTELDEASAEAWLERAMVQQTGSADTHPALTDRLNALGESPRLQLPHAGHTADRLLGSMLEIVTENFDQRWRDAVAPSWEERHREVQDGRRQLAELDARADSGAELTVQEAYDRANLTETIGHNPDDALTQFQALHERVPNDALVCFSLGARLLHRNDASGCALIEHVMHLDENATANCCELLRDYHWRNDRQDEAHAWHQRLVERVTLQEAAAKERNGVAIGDRFERHGLAENDLATLRSALRSIPGLRKAYLVRKRVKHLPHSPCFVFGFKTSRWYQLHNERRAREVLRLIQESVSFPGETILINLEGNNSRFGRKFSWMRGARIL